MHVVRDPLRSTDLPRGGIVTIGNFDGVHLGHRSILEAVGHTPLVRLRRMAVDVPAAVWASGWAGPSPR